MTAAADPALIDAAEARRHARRQAQMAAWRRRSRLIGRLRRILPATMVLLLVVLGAWVLVKGFLTGFGDGQGHGATIHMSNAHFYGRDGEDRPYILSASEATRQSGDMTRLNLAKPALTYNAEGLKPTTIAADQGVYREDSRMLGLAGHVTLTDDAGDVFTTPSALVDTQKLTVNGWNGVRGTGPRGVITARAYGVYDHGEHIVFSGDVHSVMKPD